MTTTDLVRFATFERAPRAIIDSPAAAPSYHQLVSPVRNAIVCARRLLLSRRQSRGQWIGRQIGDASLPSQLLMLLAYFGREGTELADQAANAVLRDQLADGGWPAIPGGAADLSVSVQAYFALKLSGQKPNRPHMVAARQVIRTLGGADHADAETRLFLALFGQIDYDKCGSSAANVSWSGSRPRRSIELSRGVRELFASHPDQWPLNSEIEQRNSSQFLGIVEQILSEHVASGNEIPAMSFASEEALRPFIVIDHERDEARPYPGMSPAVDTAIVSEALQRSGIRGERLESCCPQQWPTVGDQDTVELAAIVRRCAASCRNRDDDSALPPEIQMLGDRRSEKKAIRNDDVATNAAGHEQVLSMLELLLSRQNCDGGWSACALPRFASEPSATAAALEALSHHRFTPAHESLQRGIEYLRRQQRADGSWDSATGVRFIHGTSRVVRGLLAAGVSADDPAIEAGVNWLLVHQQESGGWGEAAPSSNANCDYMPAAASAIQTAWAVSSLVAAGLSTDDATLLGVQFLVDTQEEDGDWQDAQFTLRDPATATWYRNEIHLAAESLAALADWAVAAAKEQEKAERVGLKLCST
jgi:Squalene-hopene cyclase C-terminal domain/Squalene-hopene cyclase N-terminal domain